MNNNYQLELEDLKEYILNGNFDRILLQLPEGMLDAPLKTILQFLSPLKKQLIVSGNPCYGACDLAIDLAIKLNCDLLLHFGHTNFAFERNIKQLQKKVKVLFIPAFTRFSILPIVPPLIDKIEHLNWKKIVLVATAQHLPNLKELHEILGKTKLDTFIQSEGQILGCNIRNAMINQKEVDGIISLHSGSFHTRGLILNSPLPILQVDLFTGEISFYNDKDRNKMISQRHAVITQASNAKYWGILASTKLGQYNPSQVTRAEKIISNNNMSSTMIISDNINPDYLSNFPWIDAWIDTACPRMAVDDKIRFKKPIITYKEFLYLFNELLWEDLLRKGFY